MKNPCPCRVRERQVILGLLSNRTAMLKTVKDNTVLKYNWLLSLLACTGLWSITLPVLGQALLPYTPQLNNEQLEQQGLELADDAVQLVRFQQYELALSRAKLATQLAPNQFQSWFILGTLYIQQKELDKGVEALQKALSLAPSEAGIKFTLGNAYFQQGKYQEAATELQDGLKIKPDTPAALFDLGNSYLKLNKMSDAIASYQKAIALEKNFWPAINNIGLIKYEQGDINGAVKDWQTALEIDPEQAEPQLAVAVGLYIQGKTEQGLKLGEAALKLDSRYAELKFLEENLWGPKLLQDTQKFLATPQMKAILDTLQQESSS